MDWWDRLWDNDVAMFVIALLCVVGLIAVVVWGAIALDRRACEQVAEVSGHRTRWELPTGCFVEVNGVFVPGDNWRIQ